VVPRVVQVPRTRLGHLDQQEEGEQNTGLDLALLQVLQAQVRSAEIRDIMGRSDIQDHPLVHQAQVPVQTLALTIPHHRPPQIRHHRRTTIRSILQLVAVIVVLRQVLHLHPKLAAVDLNVGTKSTSLEFYCRIRRLFVPPTPSSILVITP
ncbi:unnamed protein product, partial [Rodentolepis nana]|uniref:Secreted protein n=1 Tax=Rodentolepis nana TaxID=102285 RepID=A0A0R3TXE9_RODNA